MNYVLPFKRTPFPNGNDYYARSNKFSGGTPLSRFGVSGAQKILQDSWRVSTVDGSTQVETERKGQIFPSMTFTTARIIGETY